MNKAKKLVAKKGHKQKSRSVWYYIGQWILWILTIISVTGLLLACFGGNFNPNEVRGLSLMILTLPAWLILWIIVTFLDLLWCRKAMVFCILAFIACANAIWDYCPLNIFGPSEKKYASCPKFTLLTYNICNYYDLSEEYPGDINPTLSYIIRQNADIVNLQETTLPLDVPSKRFHITRAQLDTINQMYPYRVVYGSQLTLLSKYPVEAIHTPPVDYGKKMTQPYYPIGVFRLNIEGQSVTLFDVHLRSYGLTKDDKTLYKNITDGKEIAEAADGSVTQSLRDIKSQIYRKVQSAAEKRANETEILCRYIEKFGGPNVIVAGDFNDVPGCYTLRRLEDCDMRQVYPSIGFGPMITFNADMFYFRIDHVLYRGDIVPLSMKRGSTKSSDHYPLMTTFAITKNQK